MKPIDKDIMVLKDKGWMVLKRHDKNYFLKNRNFKGFSGFVTEMDAWRFLLRVKEPRPKATLEEHKEAHDKEVQQERFQIKHDFFTGE